MGAITSSSCCSVSSKKTGCHLCKVVALCAAIVFPFCEGFRHGHSNRGGRRRRHGRHTVLLEASMLLVQAPSRCGKSSRAHRSLTTARGRGEEASRSAGLQSPNSLQARYAERPGRQRHLACRVISAGEGAEMHLRVTCHCDTANLRPRASWPQEEGPLATQKVERSETGILASSRLVLNLARPSSVADRIQSMSTCST